MKTHDDLVPRFRLEVDLVLRLAGKLVPIEVKLTATPTLRHAEVLGKLKALAGQAAAAEGVVVCSVAESRPLPGNNVAIPWRQFPQWLSERLG